MENPWLNWVKRLQSIAVTGKHFFEGPYDRERYEEIEAIANAMLANLANLPTEKIVAIAPKESEGYITPKVDVRAAVIKDDKILLVQEKCDGLWTLPGGYADVGLSPSENTIKEVWEEAGLKVAIRSLYAIRHKAKHEYDPDVREYYKFFFLCDSLDDREPVAGEETSAAQYFSPNSLPSLSAGRTIAKDITSAFEFLQTGAIEID